MNAPLLNVHLWQDPHAACGLHGVTEELSRAAHVACSTCGAKGASLTCRVSAEQLKVPRKQLSL